MNILVNVVGTIDASIMCDYDKRKLAENYPNGVGLYAVLSDDTLIGFVAVSRFNKKEGQPDEVSCSNWIIPDNVITKTAVEKETKNLAISFSEAVAKITDIVSTEKANQKACLEHIEHLLEDISENRGSGISEKTLLAALEIVKGKGE